MQNKTEMRIVNIIGGVLGVLAVIVGIVIFTAMDWYFFNLLFGH